MTDYFLNGACVLTSYAHIKTTLQNLKYTNSNVWTLYIWKWNRQGLDMCEEALIFLDHGFSGNLEDVQIHREKGKAKCSSVCSFDLHQILQ